MVKNFQSSAMTIELLWWWIRKELLRDKKWHSTPCSFYPLLQTLTCYNWIRHAAIVSKSLDTSNEVTKLVNFSPKSDSHLPRIYEKKACLLTSLYGNYQQLGKLWCSYLTEYKHREAKTRLLDVQAQVRTFGYLYGLRNGI